MAAEATQWQKTGAAPPSGSAGHNLSFPKHSSRHLFWVLIAMLLTAERLVGPVTLCLTCDLLHGLQIYVIPYPQ